MGKRAFKRLPIELEARLFYGNLVYTGIVTNLSEGGMFISTKVNFSVDSVLVTSILVNREAMKLPIRIIRSVRLNNNGARPEDNGIGVQLIDPPGEYLKFVDHYRNSYSISLNS